MFTKFPLYRELGGCKKDFDSLSLSPATSFLLLRAKAFAFQHAQSQKVKGKALQDEREVEVCARLFQTHA